METEVESLDQGSTKRRSELQKGVMKKELPKKYNELSISQALETGKQRLTALAMRLKTYTRDIEVTHQDWRLNNTGKVHERRRHHVTAMLSGLWI